MAAENAQFDVVVLGGGIGGYVCAIRAAQFGLRVAVVEKDKLGGVCLHHGCIPSKALFRTAEIYSLTREGGQFGVLANEVRLDWQKAQERKNTVVSQLHRGIEFLMKKNKITVLRGEGRLISATRLSLRDHESGLEREVETANIVIATGSEPKGIAGLEFDGRTVLNSYDALDLAEVPKSIVIAGSGTTGVELTSLWNALGSKVTLVEKQAQLLPREDREVGVQLERILSHAGVEVHTNAEITAADVSVADGKVRVRLRGHDQTTEVEAEKLLLMTGRSGLTRDIGLESINVQIDDTFIKTNGFMETHEPHLYAIGDVNGGPQFAHVAICEGVTAAERIGGLDVQPMNYGVIPRCVYCRPQEAGVGLTEDQAKEQGFEIRVGRFPMRANSRALIAGEPDGFVKMIADARTGEILGTFILGDGATELIGEVCLAKKLESTSTEVGRTVHPHPTISESLREAALDVEGIAIHV